MSSDEEDDEWDAQSDTSTVAEEYITRRTSSSTTYTALPIAKATCLVCLRNITY